MEAHHDVCVNLLVLQAAHAAPGPQIGGVGSTLPKPTSVANHDAHAINQEVFLLGLQDQNGCRV